jgi:hypothetical protein
LITAPTDSGEDGEPIRREAPLGPGDIRIEIREATGADDAAEPLEGALSITTSDFPGDGADQRSGLPPDRGLAWRVFSAAGRDFVVGVEFGRRPVPDTLVARANELLATFRAEPGDFYPGEVAPGSFEAAPGWVSGSSGAEPREAGGEQAVLWASTLPLDDPLATWPACLEQLRPNDVFILVWLWRLAEAGRWEERSQPCRLADADVRPGWEGQPAPNVPEYLLLASTPGGTDVEIRAYFGRSHATPEQIAAADTQLARLRSSPDWGPWELG